MREWAKAGVPSNTPTPPTTRSSTGLGLKAVVLLLAAAWLSPSQTRSRAHGLKPKAGSCFSIHLLWGTPLAHLASAKPQDEPAEARMAPFSRL